MPDGLLTFIGLATRQVREAAGFSQEDMARRLGVSRSAIGALERGQRWPRDPDHAVAGYARAAGMQPVELWARAVVLLIAARPILLIAE